MEERFIYTEERPWGYFTTLYSCESCKVKTIVVNPGHRLSYQSHSKRQEQWIVVEGEAKVTIDGKDKKLKIGQSIKIPLGAKHRIQNDKKEILKFIEVQTGSYFGEDDIVRYQDDYDRK